MSHDKVLIGSEEWFAFPSLGIPAVKARIDSGAKTSSIHAINITAFKRQGAPWVSFEVHPLQNDRRTLVRCEAPVVDRRSVKSSSGDAEKRYVIQVPMVMGEDSWQVELTLANRDSMGYRMLLGREAMVGRFLVDPGGRFVHGDRSPELLSEAYGSLVHSPADGLNIGLLATEPDSYSNQRIVEAAEERGHRIHFLDLRHSYMKLDAEAPEIRYRGGWLMSDLDAVIPRVQPEYTFYGCALARQCESMGIETLNAATAISQSRDPLFALQRLLKQGLEIPVTGFADSPVDTRELVEMVGGAPLVIKLMDGARGRDLVLAETDIAAESVINALKSARANLLVQEYIREAQGKDLRCLVVDGKLIASVEYTAVAGSFRGDDSPGGSVKKARVTAPEKKLAIQAARTMGLCVARVDMIRSNRGTLLLGVEPSPDLEELETAVNRDLAGSLVAVVERRLNWRRRLAAQ